MKDKIYQLISSTNPDDNRIGYTLLRDNTLEDIKSWWRLIYEPLDTPFHPYWKLQFDNDFNTVANQVHYYRINENLFAHHNAYSVYFTNKGFKDWNGYIIL